MRRVPVEELAARGEVVKETLRFRTVGLTMICFESGAWLNITDLPHDHRVEAFVP